VLTPPADLPERAVADELETAWGIASESISYQHQGFGSHHWLVTAVNGDLSFATVDDLLGKSMPGPDPAGEAYNRLSEAFEAALWLRQDAALSFVVAPIPTLDGRVIQRLSQRYSLVLHPFVAGDSAGEDGEFASDLDRRAVLSALIQLHRSIPPGLRTDDFRLPRRHQLKSALSRRGQSWNAGLYGEHARALLNKHAADVRQLLSVYDVWAARVASRTDRMVPTHGEPHAGNVLVTTHGPVLIDWETVMVAPPERDLWTVTAGRPELLDEYTKKTDFQVDSEAMALYALQFDLMEIAEYLALFSGAHEATGDTHEAWVKLRRHLQPTARWPQLFPPPLR
jgi:hypothetical protein